MRRIPGVGWELDTGDGEPSAILRDGGQLLAPAGDLVGTREAAEILGVLPPNFVRDWAARADFPAPAGEVAGGRVWRAADVRLYARRRRRTPPDQARLDQIARRVAWWEEPADTLRRPGRFIARVLARGGVEEILDVRARFGEAAIRRAVRQATADLLDERARNYWQLVLGLPVESAKPARTPR